MGITTGDDIVIGTLYRFGTHAIVVDRFAETVQEKLLEWYFETYVEINGTDPHEDAYMVYPNGEVDTYYDDAESCIEFEYLSFGEVYTP